MAKLSLDFADVKPSAINWIVVGLMAVTFIAFFKFIMERYPIPGLKEVAQAV